MNKKFYLFGLSLLLVSELLLAQEPGLSPASQRSAVSGGASIERAPLNRSIVELLNKVDQLQKRA